MRVNLEDLRDFRRQVYEPTVSSPRQQPFEEWKHRVFDNSDIASVFHENTKYDEVEFFRTEESMIDFTENDSYLYAVANIRPDYSSKPKLELPEPERLDSDVTSALYDRQSTREFSGGGISLQEVSTLLAHSCGISHSLPLTDDESDAFSQIEKHLRTYPSSGGLYPIETYIAVTTPSDDFDYGLYYYLPEEHALRVLQDGDHNMTERIRDLFVPPTESFDPSNASINVFLTSVSWRCKAKYGPRGYRYALQESGHIAQNLLLTTTAMGLESVPVGGIFENRVDEFLGVDGTDETAVYSVSVGTSEAAVDV